MPALLLQKLSFKSEAKEHTICLKLCLHLWGLGDFDALLHDCRTIHSTLLTSKKTMSEQQLSKTLASLRAAYFNPSICGRRTSSQTISTKT